EPDQRDAVRRDPPVPPAEPAPQHPHAAPAPAGAGGGNRDSQPRPPLDLRRVALQDRRQRVRHRRYPPGPVSRRGIGSARTDVSSIVPTHVGQQSPGVSRVTSAPHRPHPRGPATGAAPAGPAPAPAPGGSPRSSPRPAARPSSGRAPAGGRADRTRTRARPAAPSGATLRRSLPQLSLLPRPSQSR